MRLHILDGGRIHIRTWNIFDPGTDDTDRWLSNACFLLAHPDGLLLWDTGLPDAVGRSPDGVAAGPLATFHVVQPIRDQLRTLGVGPGDVDMVALSHMHRDHLGNLSLFRQATLVVQDDEFSAATAADAASRGYDPASCAPALPMDRRACRGDLDVFGDNSVIIKRLPGHTVGSQALLVRLPTTGSVLLSGDLAHSRDNWRRRTVPTINHDRARTVASLDAADELMRFERGSVWIQHDREQIESLMQVGRYFG